MDVVSFEKIKSVIDFCYKDIEIEDLPAIQKILTELIDYYINNSDLSVFNDTIPEESRIVLIGDIHCDLNSPVNILKKLSLSDYPYLEKGYFILLGDYVDRGLLPIGSLLFILNLKKILGNRLILLRGNHDDFRFNEAENKFYSPVSPCETVNYLQEYFSKETMFKIKDFFERLPFFVSYKCREKKFLISHASITKDIYRDKFIISELKKLKLEDLYSKAVNNEISNMLYTMMWGDPVNLDYRMQNSETRFEFGIKQFKDFAEEKGFTTLVRGHETANNGLKYDINKSIITISSSGGRNNLTSYFANIVPYPVFLIIDEKGEVIPESIFVYNLNLEQDENNKFSYLLENETMYSLILNTQEEIEGIGKEIKNEEIEHFHINKEFSLKVNQNKSHKDFLLEYFGTESEKLFN